MSEFVGRTGSHRVYSYPEARRGILSLARNFAIGPAAPTPILDASEDGTAVPWGSIESGAPAGTSVPITPRFSGLIRISGVIAVENTDEELRSVLLQAQGSTGVLPPAPIPAPTLQRNSISPVTVPEEGPGYELIPFVVLGTFPIGVQANIGILMTAAIAASGMIVLVPGSSTIDLQEVVPATG